MARYIIFINNDERLDNGEEDTLEDVALNVSELLRSGYYEVEDVSEIVDKRPPMV